MQVGFGYQVRMEDRIAIVKKPNRKGDVKESAIPYQEPYIDGRVVLVHEDGRQETRCEFSGYVYSRNGLIDYRFKYDAPGWKPRRMADKKPEPKLLPMNELLGYVSGDVHRFGPEVKAAILASVQAAIHEVLAARKEHKLASHAKREEERKQAA